MHTLIQWCDSTVNGSTGCDGCELWALLRQRADLVRVMGGPCYAGALHEGRMAKTLPQLYAPSFTEVRLAPGRMAKAAAWGDLRGKVRPDKPWIPPWTPRIIFVGDLGDVMSKAVPFEYLRDEVFAAMRTPAGARHFWLILTKRPGRLAEFSRWLAAQGQALPANCGVGTSITNRATLGRAAQLLQVPATLRFLSLEPLWEGVDLFTAPRPDNAYFRQRGETGLIGPKDVPDDYVYGCKRGVGWLIVGGQSDQGPHKARPFNLRWARDLIGQGGAAGVPVLVKQLGSRPVVDRDDEVGGGIHAHLDLKLRDHHGGDWDEWPEDLRVRQMPDFAGLAVAR